MVIVAAGCAVLYSCHVVRRLGSSCTEWSFSEDQVVVGTTEDAEWLHGGRNQVSCIELQVSVRAVAPSGDDIDEINVSAQG